MLDLNWPTIQKRHYESSLSKSLCQESTPVEVPSCYLHHMDYQTHNYYLGTSLSCLFYLLCYALVLKFLTYAQYYNYADVKDLCLNLDCFIRVYSLVS